MSLAGSSRFLSRGQRLNLFAVFRTNCQSLPAVLHVSYDDSSYCCALPRRAFSTSSKEDDKEKKKDQKLLTLEGEQGLALQTLLERPKRMDVVKRLAEEKEVRVMMPFGEFSSICKSVGLNGEEASELSQALHISGTIFQLSSESGKKLIYLRPEALINAVVSQMDPEGLLVEEKKNELAELRGELDALDHLLGDLQQKAQRNATYKMWGFFGLLTGQTAVLARLTWWEFSWDIMEPITYFITMSGATFALLYTNITKEEYGHESFHARLARRKLQKLMGSMGIAPEKRPELVKRIEQLKSELHSHGYMHLLKDKNVSVSLGVPEERRLTLAELTSGLHP